MMTARPAAWAETIFHHYVSRLFRRHFHAIFLLGDFPQIAAALPLLLAPNHSTWWDGFFVHLLNKKIFARRPYVMMLEEQLVRYPFFTRLGVFSINPHSAADTRASLRYAARILRDPQNLLCIFPQGELLPWDKRPLGFKRGVEILLRWHAGPVNLLPLAIRVEFLGEQLPSVFFMFGENVIAEHSSFAGVAWLEKCAEELLERMRVKIANGERGMQL